MSKYFKVLILIIILFSCDSDSETEELELTDITVKSNIGNVLLINQSTQLEVDGFDQNGDQFIIDSEITWEVNNDFVALDQNGLLSGKAVGTSIITVSTQGLIETIEIAVEARKLTNLFIHSSNGTKLDLNESTQLSLNATDQMNVDYTISSDVTWTINNNNISIDQSQLITGLVVGNSSITAQVESVVQSIDITVWDSSAPRTEIYVSDVGANRNGPHLILKYDEDGSNGTKFISSNLSSPQDIVFFEDQEVVIVSNFGSNKITKYDSNSGEYIGIFADGINAPTRMEIGPDGLLYVLPWSGGMVKRFELDGTFVDDFTDLSVNQAIGIAWDNDNNLYVSSFNQGANGFVRVFDQSGADQGLFINSNLAGPTDIWFDESGNLLVNDWTNNKVVKFSSSGAFIEDFITGLSQPEGVDILNGNTLIGNSGDGSVKMYDKDGAFIENIVSAGSAGLNTTNAVTVRYVNH